MLFRLDSLAFMMKSSNRNIFRVTSPLRGETTGHRWIPLTKVSYAELWCFLIIWVWTNGWANNQDAGDLRRLLAHHTITVMYWCIILLLVQYWCCSSLFYINRMSIPRFCEILQRIQNDPRCENLDLASCLKEPQQRFSEYPEMLKEVTNHLVGNDQEMFHAEKAYETI